ncbi:MAG: sensor histidine kinase, partial [Clostridium sp.]|nr:sensor histidine kinase [Clostridium sp.]
DKYYRESYNIAMECFDTSDGVVALYLYNGEDEIISTYRRAVTPRHNYPLDIYEHAEENNADLVRQYAHSNQTTMLVSSYFNPNRDTDIIRLVMKLYNNSNTSQMIGYIACDVDSKIFRYRMEKFITDSDMFMWLQPVGDRAAVSVGSLGKNDRKLFDGITDHLCRGEQDFSLPTGGSQRVFFQMDQNKYNLSAYALMPQALLAANQRTLTASLFTIAAVMLVITLVFTFLWSKSLTRPLEELTEMTDRIKKGETDLRVAVKKHDEIGALGQSFNEMLDQIEALLVREYETKLLLNRAEYNALQAQINPHFLYNTLDTMSSIAQVRHCDEVSHLCQSLSNIFRYSLDMKNPFSTVAKEIVHLKNYIYVMDVRMRDHVAYEFDIDDEVLKDTVPRICVQPLVENALNHGLRNVRGEKQVVIRAKMQEENLVIAVEDNGVGLENAEELNQKMMENNLDLVERGNSIGLININARVKMLYGDAYGIRVESAPGTGTRVYLTVARLTMGEVEQWKKKSIKS